MTQGAQAAAAEGDFVGVVDLVGMRAIKWRDENLGAQFDIIEIPADMWADEVPDGWSYEPVISVRSAPDPKDVDAAVRVLVEAERPVLYAGQGVNYAQAWDELKQLAELLGIVDD